ncbi:FecR family protein [Chitinophaga jiangningensis]|uniref:FecR family protein n=1 Tax=Chitinophaga jiangningensis TaxID=1419482 RepID=A0A1M7JZJ9_9BACT|nr:FecR family protein [Chitinophaga jiangningensis]SHM58384.1 FecR family protein [Chitinophaga jiangningensis]
MDKHEAKSLLGKYLDNRCTPEEKAAVEQWYHALQDDYQWTLEGARRLETQADLKQKIDRAIGILPQVVPLYRRPWLRYAAAILLLAAVATWMLLPKHTPAPAITTVADLLPGSNKATLTLGNGTTLTLDSASNRHLATQGSTQVSQQKGGMLVYTGGRQSEGQPEFNTLTTPKGGQYRLTLPDGSKVWLNAMSSLRFPASFPGKERRVEVQGEAYFDIATNTQQPFIVMAANTAIEVLGTKFNVNAYTEQQTLTTTLLQGKVKVSSANTVILEPGQQSVNASSGKQMIRIVDQADTELATAWMNGYFRFKQASVQEVMQQIARWYDIEVSYEGLPPAQKFSGEISRTSKLSEVLTGLSMSGIHTKVTGNKVIIIP